MTEIKRSNSRSKLGTPADLAAFWEGVTGAMTEPERLKYEEGIVRLRETMRNHVPARRRLPDGTLERTRTELEAEVEQLKSALETIVRESSCHGIDCSWGNDCYGVIAYNALHPQEVTADASEN